MAELTPKERLQPSLLDRLTDEDPGTNQESREQRVLSIRQLRESVLRDLVWLLNTDSFASVAKLDPKIELEDYPMVAESVVNYGMPDLAGKTGSSIEPAEIEAALKRILNLYEPRLIPRTVSVRVKIAEGKMNRNAMSIEIEGELWAQPFSERMFLRTEVDLETGNASVEDFTGREL